MSPSADPTRRLRRPPPPSAPRRRRPRAALLAPALAGLACLSLLAAACGGPAPSRLARVGSGETRGSSSSSKPLAASAQLSDALAFARCIRSQGVPNWPDPESSGSFPVGTKELAASNPRFQAAASDCRHLLPNGGAPTPAEVQQMRAQALRFTQCVRGHGVTNFPDPQSDGRIPDPASFGIDQGSPLFQAANQACGRYRPPYVPSNAAYDAYARSAGA